MQSTDTLRPEKDISSKDGGGSPESRSTTGSTDTTVTSAAVLTRPVLTRQGKRQPHLCMCAHVSVVLCGFREILGKEAFISYSS